MLGQELESDPRREMEVPHVDMGKLGRILSSRITRSASECYDGVIGESKIAGLDLGHGSCAQIVLGHLGDREAFSPLGTIELGTYPVHDHGLTEESAVLLCDDLESLIGIVPDALETVDVVLLPVRLNFLDTKSIPTTLVRHSCLSLYEEVAHATAYRVFLVYVIVVVYRGRIWSDDELSPDRLAIIFGMVLDIVRMRIHEYPMSTFRDDMDAVASCLDRSPGVSDRPLCLARYVGERECTMGDCLVRRTLRLSRFDSCLRCRLWQRYAYRCLRIHIYSWLYQWLRPWIHNSYRTRASGAVRSFWCLRLDRG